MAICLSCDREILAHEGGVQNLCFRQMRLRRKMAEMKELVSKAIKTTADPNLLKAWKIADAELANLDSADQ